MAVKNVDQSDCEMTVDLKTESVTVLDENKHSLNFDFKPSESKLVLLLSMNRGAKIEVTGVKSAKRKSQKELVERAEAFGKAVNIDDEAVLKTYSETSDMIIWV